MSKNNIGILKGKFPFKVEKHIIVNGKPLCKPKDKQTYIVLTDPSWKITCKNCKKLNN
jgi:hypothetical protein